MQVATGRRAIRWATRQYDAAVGCSPLLLPLALCACGTQPRQIGDICPEEIPCDVEATGCNVPDADGGWLPLAIGNWWRISIEDAAPGGVDWEKTWCVVAAEGDGSLKIRNLGNEPKFKWVRHDEARGRYVWTKGSDFLNEACQVVREDRYEDRLRLDYSREVGVPWQEEYDETITCCRDLEADFDACAESKPLARCPDPEERLIVESHPIESWEVVPVPDEAADFLSGFSGASLCERRDYEEAGVSATKYYCFVDGVGKVWESDGSQPEYLGDYCLVDSP